MSSFTLAGLEFLPMRIEILKLLAMMSIFKMRHLVQYHSVGSLSFSQPEPRIYFDGRFFYTCHILSKILSYP